MRPFGPLVLLALAFACTGCGARFGPGFPCTKGTLFSQPPIVERRGDAYFLTWTQGSYPFFFEPSYRPIKGRLIFAVQVTTSSGNLAGRHRESKIEGAENLQALQAGGAFWWEDEPEPDGRLIPLKTVLSATEVASVD